MNGISVRDAPPGRDATVLIQHLWINVTLNIEHCARTSQLNRDTGLFNDPRQSLA